MTQELFETDACSICQDAAIACTKLGRHGDASSPIFACSRGS